MFRLGSNVMSLRRGALTTAIVLSLTAVGSASFRFHDTRMDDADAALEKAAVLIGAASCAAADAKNQRTCERALGKALTDIDSARLALADAMAASDAAQ